MRDGQPAREVTDVLGNRGRNTLFQHLRRDRQSGAAGAEDEGNDRIGRQVFYDPQARFHAQSYGGGQSLLDSQTAGFKRGADMLGVDAALVRMRGETKVYLPVVAR